MALSRLPRTGSPPRSGEHGEVGVGVMLAVVFTLLVAIAVVNVFTFLYGQAVVRSALDEGVRAGSRIGAGAAVCESRAAGVLDDLLAGKLGDGVTITCAPAGLDRLVATAQATFDSPMPGVPSWTIRLEATAVQETGPTAGAAS